jgi:hypothetical protein
MDRKPTKKEQKEISQGVEKMVDEYEKTGKVKTSKATYRPENKKKAIKQALAIEYGKHKAGRAGDKGEKKEQ